MLRIVLSAVAGVVALLIVSVGLCQTLPNPVPPTNAPVRIVRPTDGVYDLTPLPPDLPAPKALGQPLPGHGQSWPTAVAAAPAEKMVVKVYSVPDLVADIQRSPVTPGLGGGDPELAAAMQHVQLYVQAAQKAAGQPEAPAVADVTTVKLERLKKALRIAAPRKSWTEEGGDGEIEVYPEALSLIVRQTASGHEAIEDLLTQLRATQNVQIELTIEMMSFDGVPDDVGSEAMKLVNRELSADELAQFRKSGCKSVLSSTVRMANGQTAGGGLPLPLRFTAVAAPDRSFVEFRTELALPKDEEEPVLQVLNQSRTVASGKTIVLLVETSGDAVMLVTPKIIDRSAGAAK